MTSGIAGENGRAGEMWAMPLTCTTPDLCHSSCQRSAFRCQQLARPDEFWWTPGQLSFLLSSLQLWWRLATFYCQTLNGSWGGWACYSRRRDERRDVLGQFSAEPPRQRRSWPHPAANDRTETSGGAAWLHQLAGSWSPDHLTFAWRCRRGRARSSTDMKEKEKSSRSMILWAGAWRGEIGWRWARMPSLHIHEQGMIF